MGMSGEAQPPCSEAEEAFEEFVRGRSTHLGMSGEAQPPCSEAEEAFEEFVRGRSTHLFRLALVLTGWNRAAAEDVLQIALERAYRRRWLLFREGSAEPYVRRVVVNAAIDWRRVLRRRGEQPLDVAVEVAVADRTNQVADRDVLVRALAALAPKQRAVLVLRFWEDLSDGEIAATLNCSAGTVRSQASRGLTRLRELTGAQPAARSDYSSRGEHDE
jgi:RNA polymerase sigma-70 factor (sigma-E family)